MRVLIVAHSGVEGGSNNTIFSLLEHRPPGVEATWVFLEDGPAIRRVDVPWALVPAGRAREVWKVRGTVRRLRAAIRETGAEVVFAHITKAHLYASVAARLEGVPYLWWQQERYGQKPLMHQVSGRLRADAVICSADHTAAEQRRRFPGTPVIRVHLGVPTDPLPPPREHGDRDELLLGVVGRLQRWKRVELAIRALPAVRAAVPNARLRVIGTAFPGLDEDYPGELRAEAERLGVAEAVDFAGHIDDGAGAIGGLDVLVHCAELEPFGLVPVEAMLHGVPPVVPDEGGPRETVRHGVDGLRVDPTDADALAAAIIELAKDPARRAKMGDAGRERVLARFTSERMAQRAWAVVAAVAARSDPRAAVADG
jgi:glycosyltransferase involved in cell wall biosynthesis